VQIIALTGGIASGKSTVSARLAEHGAVIVDADRLAREVVEPGTPGLAAIRERFGDGVVAADGSLDRMALGRLVFADPDALADLNAITHPAVWRAALERFGQARASDPDGVVVYDVPLLVEASADRPLRFDRVVVVEADREERVRRLVEDRGMDHEDARRRIDAQADDEQRRAVADVVIDNNGGKDELLRRVDALWTQVSEAATGSARRR
jgi:dephospho-CoA kinase